MNYKFSFKSDTDIPDLSQLRKEVTTEIEEGKR